MKVKAILFDLDGTIFDISERDAFACYEALSHLGYNVSLDEVKQHYRYGIGLMGTLKELKIKLAEKETEDYLNARFTSFIDRKNALNLTKIHEGACDALASLSQKYKLILVTSRNKLSSVEEELEWFNIKKFFALIVTRELAARYHGVEDIPLFPFQEQRTKLYECTIGLTKIEPKNIVCIGDSLGELEPAKRLQMTTIGVLTGISSKENLQKASNFIIQDITQVDEILSRING